MSAGAHSVTVPGRRPRAEAPPRAEPTARTLALIRLTGFTALALYGVERWSRLLGEPSAARLLGLAALAAAIAGGVPLLRRLGGPPAAVAVFALCLLALPIAGLPWQDFVHLRLALGARHVADGLSGLPAAILPYTGAGRWVPTVIMLGAAVLLLDAAVVLAFAPAAFGDLRRGGAALPLVALAVVPATLVRPQLPYLQGVVLFGLLAVFMWGERLRRQTLSAAFVLAAIAAAGAGILAPRLDTHHAWVDYRAWAGTLVSPHVDYFAWNQTYGPLHWPRRGHVVLTVEAHTGDYWKAENLDVFNGTAWVAGSTGAPPLPAPGVDAVSAWSQVIKVRFGAIRSQDVIASGAASPPSGLTGVGPGVSDGTWRAEHALGPGTTYVVNTYSPRPTPAQLAGAGRDYPGYLLNDYRTIALPEPGVPPAAAPQLVFPGFYGRHRTGIQAMAAVVGIADPAGALARSPYGAVYALARRLGAGARTPAAYVAAVMRYLRQGFAYSENPPASRDPLVTFLLHSRLGYCQQFSGAMALLLRMGGVPARVATGFTTGSRQASSGAFAVTDVDAHAWVEAWFPHIGWVRFDPTPPAAPARGGAVALPFLKSLAGAKLGAAGAHGLGTVAVAAAPRIHRRNAGPGLGPWPILAAALLVALVLGTLATLRGAPADGEGRLRELERALARTGRPLSSAITLAELEHRFRESPEAAAYVRALRLERFRGGVVQLPSGARRALRRELGAGLGWRGRLRAIWALPPRPSRH